MWRWMIAVVVVVAASGCGRDANEARTSAPAEAAEATALTAAADRCLAYQLDYWKRTATGLARGEAAAPPDLARYACADLYDRPGCASAWPTSAEAIASPAAALRVARALTDACAAAYCPQLDAMRSSVCRGESIADDALIPALVALDAQILERRLGDPKRAAELAARHRLFRRSETASPTLVVSITADGSMYLGARRVDMAELEREVSSRHDHDPNLDVTIAADRDTPYAVVVGILDTIRRLGVTRVAIAASK